MERNDIETDVLIRPHPRVPSIGRSQVTDRTCNRRLYSPKCIGMSLRYTDAQRTDRDHDANACMVKQPFACHI